MKDLKPSRNISEQDMRFASAKAGLRELLKQGRLAPASVLPCSELTLLASNAGLDPGDASEAATVVASALAEAIEQLPNRAVYEALLGINDSLRGRTLRERREVAAARANVTPESFRVRTESRYLDELAHSLLIELSASQPEATPSRSKEQSLDQMRILLLHSHADEREAATLRGRLERDSSVDIASHSVDLQPYSVPQSLSQVLREHDAAIHLISTSFLKSQHCMRELLTVVKNDGDRDSYRRRTIPILMKDPDLDLFSPTGQLQLVDYWMEAKSELEGQINSRGRDFGPALDEIRGELTVYRDIAEHIMRFLRTATEDAYALTYESQASQGFRDVVEHLHAIQAESAAQPPRPAFSLRRSARFLPGVRASRPAGPESEEAFPGERAPLWRKHLLDLYDSIVVASENDPGHPEYPPFSPRFPATPTSRIEVPQLGRQILIKDESHNLTGSHKDRMAWEIVVYYKSIIQDLLSPHAKSHALPSASIISNGSAAMAIQVMLRCFDLPSLKVLIDQRTDSRIIEKLVRAGCEVFVHDLAKRELDSSEVLQLTENVSGFDVTARNLIDPGRRTYYDWLVYEILNCGARHIFIPVGTGDLYVNVLTVLRDELMGISKDRRLLGGSAMIEGLGVYGATSHDFKTRMDKLYAPYRPTLSEAQRVADEMRSQGLCGEGTRIYDVPETIVDSALALARANNIQCDESGIAGLSLLLQLVDNGQFEGDDPILVVNTGWLPL